MNSTTNDKITHRVVENLKFCRLLKNVQMQGTRNPEE